MTNAKQPLRHSSAADSTREEHGRLGDAATRLQRMGLYLFPVDHPDLANPACRVSHHPDQLRAERAAGKAHQRGKHPAIRKWGMNTSNAPEIAALWYGTGLRNIGIACAPSGLLVLDDDTGSALADLCADHDRPVPQTFVVNTRAGRRHFYFRQSTEPLGNGLGALAGRGFDMRGGITTTSEYGGYVVAPGSRHETGAVYAAVDWDAEIAPLPGWIEHLLRVQPERYEGDGGACSYGRILGVIADLLAQTQGNRDNHLWWSACRLAEAVAEGADEVAVRYVLAAAAESIGLTAWDAENKLTRALREVGV
ncbi:bifunctional DNA primase/polymerase [Streptomyces sp. NBC_00105]|uniref:bifunctional DNA primase/polymerase n=1 Tax=Streptomyces sp. NBC_00105 TaxID=2903622 RepID=UPI00324FB1F8